MALEVLRVHQLDAIYFDDEIHELMSAKLNGIFGMFRAGLVEQFTPEITASLHALLFYLSIWSNHSTCGQTVQNLTFVDARKLAESKGFPPKLPPPTSTQKFLLFAMTVGLSWASTRFFRYAGRENWMEFEESDWRCRLWNLAKKLESTLKVLSCVNFFMFLYDGKYVSLAARLIRIRLVYAAKHRQPRGINFEFLNRQLIWQGVTEFFLFLFPLINLSPISRFLRQSLSLLHNSAPPSAYSLSHQLPPLCLICNDSPIHTPYVTQCGHVFCYYCVRVAWMEDEEYVCPVCAERVKQIKPFSVA